MRYQAAFMVAVAAVAVASADAAFSPFPSMGGGNVVPTGNGQDESKLQTLVQIGAGSFRCNLYPNAYLHGGQKGWDSPSPESLGPILDNALRYNLSVHPFLFELYSSYSTSGPLGTWSQWFNIGRQFANYAKPGGIWAQNRSAPEGYGITLYTVANEPDGTTFEPGKTPGPGPYIDAVSGLAHGVKAACPTCRTSPGGFKAPNAYNDMTLTKLGPLLAPLYNNGTLYSIDLHTYVDRQYAPMNSTYSRSAQYDFDGVRKANNITAPVRFQATEFNYKNRNVTEAQAASGLLTAVFDNAGVSDDEGNPVGELAFAWNIFHLESSDGNYGLAQGYANATTGNGTVWLPTARGRTYWMALNLTSGLSWDSADSRGTGRYQLSDSAVSPSRRLWVWQNRDHWTNVTATSWTIDNVPAGMTTVGVFGWDGLVETFTASSKGSVVIPATAVPRGGTYMACARAQPQDDDGCAGLVNNM